MSHQLYGDHSYNDVVRSTVVAQLHLHQSLYSHCFESPTVFAAFCNKVASGLVENYETVVLKAFCDAYEVKVVLLHSFCNLAVEEFVPACYTFKKVLYISRLSDKHFFSMHKVADSTSMPPPDSMSMPPPDLDLADCSPMAILLEMSHDMFKDLPTIHEPIDEFLRLEHRVNMYGFKQKFSEYDDGNCVFHAASDQLYGNEHKHDFVRNVGVAQMKSDDRKYHRLAGEGRNFDKYCNQMSKNKWADSTVTKALCDAYQIKIVELVSNVSYTFHEYIPDGNRYKKVICFASTSNHTESMYRKPLLLPQELMDKMKKMGYFQMEDIQGCNQIIRFDPDF